MAVCRAGFVAILGRPNAGKSTLLNALMKERLAMVSHKANATRKRLNSIVMHRDAQIIFVDTPGIHHQEKLMNEFMLKEALRAMGDCDVLLFLSPATDSLEGYKEFLELSGGKKHILALSKIDQLTQKELLAKLSLYVPYEKHYEALIPLCAHDERTHGVLLDEISKHLPESPALFDEEILTTENLRTLYKEMIRESLFELTSDEIPYESDVLIHQFIETPHLDRIKASIVVHKESQKGVVIGKKGEGIKRIGRRSRELMEQFGGKKIYLELFVKVDKAWSKKKEKLKEFGYNFDEE